MTKSVLLIAADGSEELETTTIHNLLTRASLDVTLAKSDITSSNTQIEMARGMTLIADSHVSQIREQIFDVIVLPGGVTGAKNLANDTCVVNKLIQQQAKDRWIAAICAAPALTLAPHGLLNGRSATCYPGFEASLPKAVDRNVVVDGKLVTSKGPGTAIEFALTLIELLLGEQQRKSVADSILFLESL